MLLVIVEVCVTIDQHGREMNYACMKQAIQSPSVSVSACPLREWIVILSSSL